MDNGIMLFENGIRNQLSLVTGHRNIDFDSYNIISQGIFEEVESLSADTGRIHDQMVKKWNE